MDLNWLLGPERKVVPARAMKFPKVNSTAKRVGLPVITPDFIILFYLRTYEGTERKDLDQQPNYETY
jgi:hypothetical protein